MEINSHGPVKAVCELRRTCGNAVAPCMRDALQIQGVGGPAAGARARINRPLVLRVRRAGGTLDVGSAARARIDRLPFLQPPERGLVESQPLGLDDGACVIVEAQPA